MKILIAIAALLASFVASAGELDGKGLICLGTKEGGFDQALQASGKFYTAYRFDGDSYNVQYLDRDGIRMKVVCDRCGIARDYFTEATEVSLRWGERRSTLDRRTLKMTEDDGRVRQCEAYATFEALEAALEEIRKQETEALKALMSENKI